MINKFFSKNSWLIFFFIATPLAYLAWFRTPPNVSPRAKNQRDTVYAQDSAYVITTHIDTAFKVVEKQSDYEAPERP